MTFYNDASQAVGLNPTDYLKSITSTNVDIEDNYNVLLRPVTSDANDSLLVFHYIGNPVCFMDLSRTLMKIELQLYDENGDEIPADREVYTIPAVLTSLFSSRRVTLGQTVFKTGEGLPYMGYFRELFSQKSVFKNTFAKATNLYYDTPESKEACMKLFTDSKTKKFYVVGYLDQVPCNARKLIPPNLGIRFEFQRTSDRFFIMDRRKTVKGPTVGDTSLTELKAKVVIKNATIELMCLKLTENLHNSIVTQLDSSPMLFDVDRCTLNAYILHAGIVNIQSAALSLGDLPTRFIVFLIDQRNFVGSYARNPFEFKCHKLRRLQLLLDGVETRKEYYINEEKDGNINSNLVYVYHSMHKFLGQDVHVNTGISFEQFANELCCFPFDLTPALNGYEPDSTSLIRTGEVSLRLEFNEPIPNNLVLLYYCEYKSAFEIDVGRTVRLLY